MAQTGPASWPALPFNEWRDTAATLHLWLQIVGKIALVQRAWVNHSWHVALRITARGIGTGLIPHDAGSFQIDFDFVEHTLQLQAVDGRTVRLHLHPQPTAEFYRHVMKSLSLLGAPVQIRTMPNELPDPIPFDKDETHRAYDAEYATRYWRVLVHAQRVFEDFRARFIGKCSPVHFFWGSADLAVTRFSGRTAPAHPGGVPHLPDWVAREAYSHEVSSAGFWAGSEQYPEACFYSYAYPEPPGYAAARVGPSGAHYSAALREFVLPYEAARGAASPEAAVMEFLQTTYEAAADLGRWQRDALEQQARR
ncbi:MAG TPA: DUF5996 family protein [Steroidobacteraceae bacterium]|nr:DUF5996 family protein [Steroidobacteraceae bacterium]